MKHISRAPFCLILFPLLLGCSHLEENKTGAQGSQIYSPLSYIWQQAERGDMTAQMELGSFYTYGQNVPKDLSQANVWYAKAAMHGNRYALTRLPPQTSLLNCGREKAVIILLKEAGQLYFKEKNAPELLMNNHVAAGIEYASHDNAYIFTEHNLIATLTINGEANRCFRTE